MTAAKSYYLMSETVRTLLFKDGLPDEGCFYTVDNCPLCGSTRWKRLFRQWGITYLRCNKCAFVFSNPRLTDKGADLWYNSEYYNAAMATEHYLSENVAKYYSISLTELHFNKLIELFKNFNFSKDASIADMGCGSGALLHYLKDELGFGNVVGYDLNSSNADFAREFRHLVLRNENIYEIEPEGRFDMVITTENIEHVSRPAEYISRIRAFIKPGGYLFITTPHNDETAVRLMGLSGDHFCAPNHQNYFNFTNLTKLLARFGLGVVDYWLDQTETFNSYAFLKRFIINRDQVTSDPPAAVSLTTIWKWQKDRNKSVIMGDLGFTKRQPRSSFDKTTGIKPSIRRALLNIAPFKLTVHQIIVARNEG